MKQLLDLFSLPEVSLITNVVEYFEKNKLDYDSVSLFHDIAVSLLFAVFITFSKRSISVVEVVLVLQLF